MDVEKIQKQVADLKTNVSLLEQSYANDFNSDLIRSLHEITSVLDSLQPRIIDPADLSKEAEQKVLNALSELTARIDAVEGAMWTEERVEEIVSTEIRNTDFRADVDVYAQ